MKENLSNLWSKDGEKLYQYRETKRFKEGIKMLEDEKGLSNQDKIIILAVTLDLKHAATIEVYGDSVNVNSLNEMFSILGVYFYRDEEVVYRVKKIFGDSEDDLIYYIIGTTPETITEAIHTGIFPIDDKKAFANSMEYPKTAIKAFTEFMYSGDDSNLLSLDSNKLSDEEKKFLFFRLSKNNYEQEIMWLEQIIAGIKKYSPKIYNNVMKDS